MEPGILYLIRKRPGWSADDLRLTCDVEANPEVLAGYEREGYDVYRIGTIDPRLNRDLWWSLGNNLLYREQQALEALKVGSPGPAAEAAGPAAEGGD